MSDPRRSIPGVDALLAADDFAGLHERYGRARVLGATREVVDAVREAVGRGETVTGLTDAGTYAERVAERLERSDVPSLLPVVNATGVVLHTNLGRAPLAAEAIDAMREAALGYSNLEYDLAEGRRGSRYAHCVALMRELTGAADALVVNNNAAALVLALTALARGKGVAVSRGELVEIGGGFRIPEIMERSGARLVEVGSTNRTRVGDYAAALESGDVAAVLKVHRSNFRMSGFTEEAPLDELAALARGADVPLVYDLGSGLLADPAALGLPAEPRASDALAQGADVVAISGDKLLGGPQAGLLLGSPAHVGAMRRDPLCRALRVDKVTLAGLAATLALYRDPVTALARVPVLRMIAASVEELEARARALQSRLSDLGVECGVAEGVGAVGGGTYPEVELPSWTVRVESERAAALAEALRSGAPPVVGRIEDGTLVLDVRTVLEREEQELAERVADAVGRIGPG